MSKSIWAAKTFKDTFWTTTTSYSFGMHLARIDCCWDRMYIWRSVRSCSQTIPEALAKIWRAAGSKVKAFSYMVRTLRSIAFQRCIWRGGPPLVEMAENEGFLQKKARKTGFLVSRFWITWLRSGLGPPILKSCHFGYFSWKVWAIRFQMSYGEACWRQCCPIGSHLNFFGEYREKMQKRAIFCI